MTTERNAQGVLAAINEAGQLLVACPDTEIAVQTAKELESSRATVEAMQAVLDRLVAWNNNVNGGGAELGRICEDAESIMRRFHGVANDR